MSQFALFRWKCSYLVLTLQSNYNMKHEIPPLKMSSPFSGMIITMTMTMVVVVILTKKMTMKIAMLSLLGRRVLNIPKMKLTDHMIMMTFVHFNCFTCYLFSLFNWIFCTDRDPLSETSVGQSFLSFPNISTVLPLF